MDLNNVLHGRYYNTNPERIPIYRFTLCAKMWFLRLWFHDKYHICSGFWKNSAVDYPPSLSNFRIFLTDTKKLTQDKLFKYFKI